MAHRRRAADAVEKKRQKINASAWFKRETLRAKRKITTTTYLEGSICYDR